MNLKERIEELTAKVSEIQSESERQKAINEAVEGQLKLVHNYVSTILSEVRYGKQDVELPPFVEEQDLWRFPDRPMRVTIPASMVLQVPQLAVLSVYVDKMGIPFETLSEGVNRYYMRELLPEHETMLQSLGITIEQRPSIPE
jgi:hypothetical protein